METFPDALKLDETAMRLAAAREAVRHLGLLNSEAEQMIYHYLDDPFEQQHPKAICNSYRKEGEQVTPHQKKALGLRSNAFLSVKALNDIGPAGFGSPLEAHVLTLLRARFTLWRYKSVKRTREQKIKEFRDEFRYDVLVSDCPVCVSLDGKIVPGDEVHIFPPSGCTCTTANYSLRMHVDWFINLRNNP